MKNVRKVLEVTAVLFIMTLVLVNSAAAFELDVRSAILADAETGQILYEKNADERLPMASITKIMPMLLAMEEIEAGRLALEDEVVISNYASSMGGSQIFLAENTEVSIEKLLKAVTIASANDATVALGEAISGTYSSFVNLMNERAAELGMEDTNFINSTGLPAENHYTTARDIVKMSREVIKYDLVLEWGQIWTENIQLPGREAMLVNTNRLINSYPGMDGIKTGYTSESGYSLAATAERNDVRLISVVMKTESPEERRELTSRLLNYGYNNFSREIFLRDEEEIQNIDLPGGSERYITGRAEGTLQVAVQRSNRDKYSAEFIEKKDLSAPVKEGDIVGEYVVKESGAVINSVNIRAVQDIGRANIFVRLWRSFVAWIGSIISSV